MTAPSDENIREVIEAVPIFLLQKRRNACAICPRGIPEDAIRSLPPRLFLGRAFLFHDPAVLRNMFPDVIILVILRKRGGEQHRPIHERDDRGHGITEKTADARRHIDARTLQLRQRDGLHTLHIEAARLPDRTNAHEIEKFRDALPVTSHIRPRPENHADAFRIPAFALDILRDDLISELFSHLPCRPCRQTPRIDAVEIHPCRQKRDTARVRRAGDPRHNVTGRKPAKGMLHFLFCLCKTRIYLLTNKTKQRLLPLCPQCLRLLFVEMHFCQLANQTLCLLL